MLNQGVSEWIIDKFVDDFVFQKAAIGIWQSKLRGLDENDPDVLADVLVDEYAGRYRDWETDRKSTRLNSSHEIPSRMPSSA